MATGCERAEPLISRLLDGELEAGDRAEVEAHLAECAACRAALDAWARIGVASIDLLRAAVPATPLRPPGPVTERRLAAVRVRRRAGSPAPAWGIPAALAACLLVALGALLALFGRADRRDDRPAVGRAEASPKTVDAPVPPAFAQRPPAPAPDVPPGPKPEAAPRVEPPSAGTPAVARDVPPPSPAPGPAVPPPAVSPSAAPDVPAAAAAKEPPATPTETAVFAARLERVQGGATLVTPAGRVPAVEGRGLVAGQGLETAVRDGGAVLRYSDGTRLELGADTAAAVPAEPPAPAGRAAPGKRLDVARGTLAAEVARQPADRPMVFSTPHAEARVLGTKFTLVVSADATRLEVQEGRVRLTRLADRQGADVGAGQCAVASKGAPPFARAVPPPVTPPPASAWRDLFTGKDLAGWRTTKGRWGVEGDAVVGEDPGGDKSRIESEQAYGDFELTCRIRVSGSRLAEFQVRNYARFAQMTFENPGAWRELRVVSRGTSLQATLDGKKVPIEAGEGGDPSAPGTIAFYVSRGGKIEIREARIRELARE